ncbi:MAG: methyltransferase domain-containing protein [Methanosarcinaceae archaeon]|nr:methyltransferase domain-containing protein [Methanosarcinaceae archaeon]
MLYAFELSGEHETLPRAEVIACLDIMGLEYTEHTFLDQCLLVDVAGSEYLIEKKIDSVAKRLAMSHHILKVIGICDTDLDRIVGMVEGSDVSDHIKKGETYAVRSRRVKHHTTINSALLERKVGGCIYRKGFHANLKKPNVEFRLLLTEKCVFGTVVAEVDRSAFEGRAPHRKPFFYPGVLMPRVALALVNMSKVKEGEILFDPFCGTAGILLEAGLVGTEVIGLDVQPKIISGARMNLEGFDFKHSLLVGDACRLPLVDGCLNAIVTDPPYGRSATIRAESLQYLYSLSFVEMYRVLKKGGFAVVVSEKPVEEFARNAGFLVFDEHLQKVHRSLTRIISVFMKGVK